MNRYIFLTSKYLPLPSANGMCMHVLAKLLVIKGYDVHVVCYSDDKAWEGIIDGVKVHKVPVPLYLKKKSLRLLNAVARFSSLIRKLIYISEYPMRSHSLRDRLFLSVEKIVGSGKNVILIATYNPIEACAAMIKVKDKYPLIKSCFYSADTLSNEMGNSAILSLNQREKYGLEWEKRIFNIVDVAFIMECHESHYKKNVYCDYNKKFRYVNFPLLIKPYLNYNYDSNKPVKRMVYAGTLYRNLRNPSALCELIIKLNLKHRCEALFMGGGDCVEIMKKFEKRSSGIIRYLGMQPHSTVEAALKDADILLSIGNTESPMAPSKIYEYMSTGKPIIHLYSWENDPCIEPLKKYGNALSLDMRHSIDVNIVDSFLLNCRCLSYEDVAHKFITSTPDYTVKILEAL